MWQTYGDDYGYDVTHMYFKQIPQYYDITNEGVIIYAKLPKTEETVKILNAMFARYGYAERVCYREQYHGVILWCDDRNSVFMGYAKFKPYPVKKHKVTKVYTLCNHEYKTLAEAKKHYVNLCKLWYTVDTVALDSSYMSSSKLVIRTVYKTLDNN
jgi:hypothetical protein